MRKNKTSRHAFPAKSGKNALHARVRKIRAHQETKISSPPAGKENGAPRGPAQNIQNRPGTPSPEKENGMHENYLISIRGLQKTGDKAEKIEMTTLGSYLRHGGSRYIVYSEYPEEGGTKKQTAVLKIEGNSCVTLIRHDSEGTRLILENGKRHLFQYETGYGNLMVGVFTNRLRSSLTDSGGKLEISYTLDINSNLSSLNELFITVKEAKKTGCQK